MAPRTPKEDRVPTVAELIPVSKRTEMTLFKFFEERIASVDEHTQQRLSEYFIYIQQARSLEDDWFYWAHAGIMNVASKTMSEQRNLAYLIGVYKNWLTYGFGTFMSSECQKIKEIFASRFNVEPSRECLSGINTMIQTYGVVETMEAILCSNAATDPSLACLKQCNEFIDTKKAAEADSKKVGAAS